MVPNLWRLGDQSRLKICIALTLLCFAVAASKSVVKVDKQEFAVQAGIADIVDKCHYPGSCAPPPPPNESSGNCEICRDGFVKDPHDPSRCKYPTGNNASLILSTFKEIRMIPLDGQNATQIVGNGKSITGIDYNFRTNAIFWFSNTDTAIYTAAIMNGNSTSTEQQSIMQDDESNIQGIAVDWIHNHVYWVDRLKEEIVVSNLNGSMKKVLFNDGFLWPLCIAVNPFNGWMYWSDSIADHIERAGLDGSQREVVVRAHSNTNGPQGLALDFVDSRLYWSQGDSPSSIWSSNFDGSDTKMVFTAKQPQLTSGDFRQIALWDKYVFFLDWETDAVRKVDKCNGQEFERMSESIIWDMKMYHPSAQPEGENKCFKRIGQCSHFCLPVPSLGNGLVTTTTCACPDGHSLSGDGQTCVADSKPPIPEPEPEPEENTLLSSVDEPGAAAATPAGLLLM